MLRSCEFLVELLKEPIQEAFQAKIVGVNMDKGPKSIKEFRTLTGEVQVLARKKANDFAAKFDEYCKDFTNIST